MKRTFKSILLFLILSVSLLSGVCAGQAAAPSALYERGLSIASVMKDMAGNDVWVSLFSSNATVKEQISRAAQGDFSHPKAVYEIHLADMALYVSTGRSDLSGLSGALQAHVRAATQAATALQINAKGGSDLLAAASACTASQLFVCNDLHENVLYLYTYENAVPVMVSFVAGESGAVSATGTFIFYDGFPTGSAEQIQQFLGILGAEVTKVSIPA